MYPLAELKLKGSLPNAAIEDVAVADAGDIQIKDSVAEIPGYKNSKSELSLSDEGQEEERRHSSASESVIRRGDSLGSGETSSIHLQDVLSANDEDFEDDDYSGEAEEDEGGRGDIKTTGPETTFDPNKYKIRPNFNEIFRSSQVQLIIQEVVHNVVGNKNYSEDDVKMWINVITQHINDRVVDLNFPRYKIITHVTIGELRGQALTSASKCVWDQYSDYSASYSYKNNTLFCQVIVFGVYFY